MVTNATGRIWGEEGTLDLGQLVATLWMRRWWIAASVILFTAVLTTAALVSTPIYRAGTVLIPTSTERSSLSGSLGAALGQVSGLAALAGANLTSSDALTEEALAVLRSRQFTERFIVDLGLLPKLFPDAWDEERRAWKAGARGPSLAQAFKYFDSTIRQVRQDRKGGLVTVQIEWRDPGEAATWANELLQRLNEEMRSRAIEKSSASVTFLEQELSSTALVETREAINRLIAAQIEQRMLANVTHEYAFRVVDRAMAPDVDDPVRPKKQLLIAGGPLLGLVVGLMMVLGLDWFGLSRRRSST